MTIGTLDGANVEMRERVGDDNIFIFGLNADEVQEVWNKGYSSSAYYNQNYNMRKVVESLIVGFNGRLSLRSRTTFCIVLPLRILTCALQILNLIFKRRMRCPSSIAKTR